MRSAFPERLRFKFGPAEYCDYYRGRTDTEIALRERRFPVATGWRISSATTARIGRFQAIRCPSDWEASELSSGSVCSVWATEAARRIASSMLPSGRSDSFSRQDLVLSNPFTELGKAATGFFALSIQVLPIRRNLDYRLELAENRKGDVFVSREQRQARDLLQKHSAQSRRGWLNMTEPAEHNHFLLHSDRRSGCMVVMRLQTG